MIVHMVWPRCEYQNGTRGNRAIDSFWVECTPDEADHLIVPRLSPQQREELQDILARNVEQSPNIFALIAQDLSSIQPMEPNYPYASLWNAYSPFRELRPLEIHDLEALRHLDAVSLIVGPQSPTDSRFARRMRFHQSWYRANRLGIPYGTGPRPGSTRLLGSMLPKEAAERGLNFLNPAIFEVARKRMAQKDGLVEPFRLLHNMLASQAMCFNLFGPLVDDPEVATALIRAIFPTEVDRVTRVEIEYAPVPAHEYLGDNTAFDAFVEYTRPDNRLAFIGIETKLSEPFSRKEYCSERYRELTVSRLSPWSSDAWPAVKIIRHNQLWRDHLLVEAMLRHSRSPYVAGRLVLVRHPQDMTCEKVVADYRLLLRPDDDTFVDLPLDRLVTAWKSSVPSGDEQKHAWLVGVQERYLQLEDSEADWQHVHTKAD